MDKKVHDEIEKLYEVEDMDGVLELLDSLSDWEKEEYGEYARALSNLDRHEEALEYLMKEQAKEDTFDWNFRVCYSYFFLENWKETIVYGTRALELGGEFEDDAAYFVMESYQELRAFDELIQFLEKHTEIEKKDWNSFYGMALMEKKELERSIPYLKKAISIWEKEGCDMSWEGEEVARALTQVYYDLKMTKEFKKMKKKFHYSDAEFDCRAYSKEEADRILEHIEKYFGKIERRIPDIDPEYANIDVLMIPASTKHPYTTLMTFGMGSRFREGTPPELVPEKFGYDELFLCLPDDWELDLDTMWAVQYLLDMARFPFSNETWLGAGHSVAYDTYLGNTNFTGFLVTYPYEYGMEAFQLELNEEKQIHFYNVIPLYTEELDYKQEIGFEELETLFTKSPMVTDIHRVNVALDESATELEEGEEKEENSQILYQ